MKLKDLQKVLSANAEASLHIMLPTYDFVPEHFHITEVGQVSKKFVDCGGVGREKNNIALQVWVATDTEHRLLSSKLSKILEMAEMSLKLENYEVELEYEGGVISQYPLTGVDVTPGGLLLRTDTKHTECLAPEKCGVSNSCCCA